MNKLKKLQKADKILTAIVALCVIIVGVLMYTIPTIPTPNKWETVVMNVSAYCPCAKCCGIWGKIAVSSGERKTASGHTIKVGDNFVASSSSYPFGTEMVIKGYAGGKVVKVEDVGGAIKGNKLDLYFDTHQDALNWGRKNVEVKVKVISIAHM